MSLSLAVGEIGISRNSKMYEVDKTEIANTMTKYQLDPSDLTAHISLGTNPSANWTQCSAAQALNTASGMPGNGNPPKAFLAQQG